MIISLGGDQEGEHAMEGVGEQQVVGDKVGGGSGGQVREGQPAEDDGRKGGKPHAIARVVGGVGGRFDDLVVGAETGGPNEQTPHQREDHGVDGLAHGSAARKALDHPANDLPVGHQQRGNVLEEGTRSLVLGQLVEQREDGQLQAEPQRLGQRRHLQQVEAPRRQHHQRRFDDPQAAQPVFEAVSHQVAQSNAQENAPE